MIAPTKKWLVYNEKSWMRIKISERIDAWQKRLGGGSVVVSELPGVGPI